MNPVMRGLVVVSAVLLGACGTLGLKQPPSTIYSPRLQLPATTPVGPPVDWQLAVNLPLSSQALDTPRILVMPTPGVLEIYPRARWSDPAPALLRNLLVEAFVRSGRILGVGPGPTGLDTNYALDSELRDFQIEYQGAQAHAHVSLNARLVSQHSNRVIAAKVFEADVAITGPGVGAAVEAMQQALDQVLPAIVDWTLAEGSAARAPR